MWPALIAVGGSLLGSYLQSQSMGDAASSNAATSRYVADLQFKMYEQAREDFKPFLEAGVEGVGRLMGSKPRSGSTKQIAPPPGRNTPEIQSWFTGGGQPNQPQGPVNQPRTPPAEQPRNLMNRLEDKYGLSEEQPVEAMPMPRSPRIGSKRPPGWGMNYLARDPRMGGQLPPDVNRDITLR